MVKAFKISVFAWCLALVCSFLSGCTLMQETDGNKDDVTLTYYHSAPLGEQFKAALQKQTQIKVNFISMPESNSDALDILLSSGSLPDIIEYSWNHYKYSPQWLIDYGYLFELNPLIEEYSPNFKKILDENPTLARQLKTTSGKYYTYPMLRLDPMLTSGLRGLIIREDWLNELNLAKPVTLEDFENVLLAFKNEKNATCPYVDYTAYDSILSAFGLQHGFYLDNGKICYGPAQPNFRDALSLLNRWMQLGLINSDGRMNYRIVQQYLISGKSGMAYGYAGSLLGTVNYELAKQNPAYRFAGISNPVWNAGDTPCSYFSEKVFSSSAAITTSCASPELAAQLLDYGFSEKGQLLYNFGIEDVSYTLTDGYPAYTDIILSEQSTLKTNMAGYIRASSSGPFLQRREYLEQYYRTTEQKEASAIWKNDCSTKLSLPVLQFTNKEHEEAYEIENALDAYTNEMFFKFIIGAEPLESFDSYIKTLNEMKLPEILEIYRTAYGRYLENINISY